MKPSISRAVISEVLLAFVFSGLVVAQSITGSLTGLVSDATGSAVPSVTVRARNTATGVVAETRTSGTGNYVIPNLAPGTYQLEATSTGFKTWIRPGIAVFAGDDLRLDVKLEVGAQQEHVEVTAAAPVLKTESAEVSETMERKLVADMPLTIGGGTPTVFSLQMMMPQSVSTNGETGGDDMRMAGGQHDNFNVSVDGLNVEMGWRNSQSYMKHSTPSIGMIEEFNIQTAAFKAEDSRVSGGLITVVTKSGTNEFHGNAFDIYQSELFGANSWLNNKNGVARSIYHRNDFGASLGGPVYVPKVYNGKNRTYFFFVYEGYRYPSTSGLSQFTIPTAAQINGDFSGWVNSKGSVIPVYDPHSTSADGATRTPFPNNQIPKSEISPIASKIASYYPATNVAGLVRNFNQTATGPRTAIENKENLKFDQVFGTKNRMGFLYIKHSDYVNQKSDTNPTDPNAFGGQLPYPLVSFSGAADIKGSPTQGPYLFRLNDTHMISPTVVNTLIVGISRMTHYEHLASAYQGTNWLSAGVQLQNNPYDSMYFPAVSFATDNYSGWDSTKNWNEWHDNGSLSDTLTWVHGSHSFKFGYDFERLQVTQQAYNTQGGTFAFSRLETAVPGDNSGASGNAFASFLLGAVDSGSFQTGLKPVYIYPYHAFFAQDDWKVTSKLTVNLGIRFEANLAVRERYDNISFFNPTLPNPGADNVPGAFQFVGSGPGRTGRNTFYNTAWGHGPRAGLAYRVNSQTVVRAGFGLFYNAEKFGMFNSLNDGFVSVNAWQSPNNGVTPAFYWDQGWPAWKAAPNISPAMNVGGGGGCGVTANICPVVWNQANDLAKLPSNMTWDVAISRELPRSFVVDLTYTGSKGTHLESGQVNVMQINPQYAYLGSLLNANINDPRVVALGFKPPFPDFSSVLGINATLGQSLRMFPQYSGLVSGGQGNHSGNSTYEALVASVTKRYSGGLSLVGSFTWSKLLTDADDTEPWISEGLGASFGTGYIGAQDQYDRRLQKSYSVLDTPALLKITTSYSLPFGPDKAWLSHGFVGRNVVGNWTLSGYVFGQSGYPMGVVDTGYTNNLDGGWPRPNLLSSNWLLPYTGTFDPSVENFLNPAAFSRRTNPAINPFGNSPIYNGASRFFPLYGEDVSLARRFRMKEKMNLDFRWEVYNMFNHHRWSNPASVDLANSQFGKITNASGNRSIQGTLKLVW
jgi:hypothetical protein